MVKGNTRRGDVWPEYELFVSRLAVVIIAM